MPSYVFAFTLQIAYFKHNFIIFYKIINILQILQSAC